MGQPFQNLYTHFPYCEEKCHYCDFFSLPEGKFKASDRLDVYQAILKELDFFELSTLKTVFLGGGTPSLVPLEVLADFFKKLPLTPTTEVTMEANPSSITSERAKAWKSFGVGRVSMGVQALDDQRLEWLGRVHDKNSVFQALDALFLAGISRISIDYIVGVPGQTTAQIRSELGEALQRYPGIEHVSAYLLTLKNSNAKFKELPSEEDQLLHLETVSEVLQEFGFEHYEISNFCKPGAQALHNENYWLGGSYLGIGPSAHSFSAAESKRTKNWASLGKYTELVGADQKPVEWEEALNQEQKRLEFLMLRLRRAEGIDLAEYRRLFGRELARDNRSWIDLWVEKRLCSLDGKKLKLTTNGFFLSDQILSKIA